MTVKEKEAPVFVPSLSVFKDGAILSNIFLSDPEWDDEGEERILKLGRHPACDIVLDHPSISRWHLQIQLQKSSQELLLTDLSSVHGTFVCGQKVTPKLPITLRLNDTFTMGASTRVYKFQWLPYPSKEEEDCPTPKFMRSFYEPNKQACACGNTGAGGSNSWNMECDCGYSDASKEQSVEEEGYANAVESISRNLAPFLFDAVLEPNKQESEFDKENMEQTSMKKGDVKDIHPSFSCEYAYYYFFINDNVDIYSSKNKKEGDVKVFESDPKNLNRIMLDGICEPTKQTCDKNKKQFLLEEEYVELAESVPWKPEQPSAAPLQESHSHLDCFTVVTDAETTPVQENQRIPREKNEVIGASNLWSTKQKYGNLLQTGRMEMNLNPKKMKENQVEMRKQRRILKENSSAEIILEEKNVRCNKKHRVLGEKMRDCILEVLPPEISAHGSSSVGFNPEDNDFYPSDKENWTSKILCQASKTTTGNIGRVDQDTHLLQTDTGRAPFQSLSQNSRVNNRPTRSSSLKNTNRSMDNHRGLHFEVQIPGIVQLSNLAVLKKKWHMVVDTGCLIQDESRQALKQLEGIKGTHLIIPRIVIQELHCLKHQNKSKQGKETREIFRWIEQCMINKGWWVHVQRSAECFSVGDVMSPTAEDHILECALLYERLPNGGHVVLLSNDVAIKIKAMAEGMLCENAREFCQSLVSPYSERFLWSESTAHGHNWTRINNSNSRKLFGLSRKMTYFGMMRNSLLRHEEPKKKSNEDAKGLKLILLHNSHFEPSASYGI